MERAFFEEKPTGAVQQVLGTEMTLPIEQLSLSLDQTELTLAQQLELGLSLDQKKVLLVDEGADALGLASAIDAGDIGHVLIREAGGNLSAILDIEWAKDQGRTHLPGTEISTFDDLAKALAQAGSVSGNFGHEWLNSTVLGRPPLVVCHYPGHHNHRAAKDPCGQP